jgi:hypothetical protein
MGGGLANMDSAIKRSLQAESYTPGVIDGEAMEVPAPNPPVRLQVAPTKAPGFKRRI